MKAEVTEYTQTGRGYAAVESTFCVAPRCSMRLSEVIGQRW